MRTPLIRRLLPSVLLAVLAFWAPAVCLAQSGIEFRFFAEGGYRVDDVDWNIAGTTEGTDPNVLSELEWSDVEILMLRAGGKLTFATERLPFRIIARGSLGYGTTVDGENRDSDYNSDNRTEEFSRSLNRADDGELLETDLAIGPEFRAAEGRVAFAPLIGYGFRAQKLTLSDGYQSIPALGAFPGLDSSYEHRWWGPFAGFDLAWHPAPSLAFYGTAEYHFASFEAEADWNLRPDFRHPKSFEHSADGYGLLLSLGASWDLSPRWSATLRADYRKWRAEDGTDRVFFIDGRTGETRLNEVNWRSASVLAGITYRLP